MNYIWYNPTIGSPFVSIATYGITFSSGAIEEMGSPQYVKLGLDADKKVLAIKPCDANDSKKIEFINKKRNGYVRISNKDFIRFLQSKMPNDITIDNKAQKFFTKWDKHENVLLVYLERPLDHNTQN